MYCTICGNESEPKAHFCGFCGTALSSGEVAIGTTQSRVGFGEAIGLGFKNYFNFNSRATRAEYWWFVLFYFLLSLIPIVNWFVWIVFLIPSISLTTRRLHDIGKTGWWQLWYALAQIALWVTFIAGLFVGIATAISGESMAGMFVLSAAALVTAIATIVWFLIWLIRQGETGSNKYGPDPRVTPR